MTEDVLRDLTFIPVISGPGKIPSARVALRCGVIENVIPKKNGNWGNSQAIETIRGYELADDG